MEFLLFIIMVIIILPFVIWIGRVVLTIFLSIYFGIIKDIGFQIDQYKVDRILEKLNPMD